MKLNNKGFAITAVLYGLLILFVILVSSYLLVLGAKKDRIDTIVKDIEAEYNERILIKYINKLYNSSEKTSVINNGITYSYAPSVSLMNDRLGDSNVPANDGNIRYYGENPNNYIYFNCSDYSNQNSLTCETWRIIGIIDGKVKLIRNESIGNYAWSEDNYNNNWKESPINTYLNGTYYNSLNSKTRELISKATYYLGGYSTSSKTYSNQIYKYERTNETGTTIVSGNPFTEETNIALMYASDYGYARDFNYCTGDLYGGCNNNHNWLYKSNNQWLITPSTSGAAWAAFSDGTVTGLQMTGGASVLPVLYLDTGLKIETGNGSPEEPYQLQVD